MNRKKIRIVSKRNKQYQNIVQYGVDEQGLHVKLQVQPLQNLHPHIHFDNNGWFMWDRNENDRSVGNIL